MNYPTKNNNDKKFDGIGGKRLKDVDTTMIHDHLMNANQVRAEFAVNDDRESFHYTDASLNRNQALRLLAKLKAKETTGSCIAWVDGQPSLIETTRNSSNNVDQWTNNGKRIQMTGSPATDTQDRVASEWEAKLERRRRAGYTLDETPTMAFKASGHLPAHYYMDESALESYVESLTKES